MFEALITLCLSTAPETCREQLVPGFEARTRDRCAAALTERPPRITLPPGVIAKGAPACHPVGAALSFAEVAPGVFVHSGQVAEPSRANRGDTVNLGFVIGQDSVAVIDAGSARWMGEAILRAVREHTDKPVSDLVLTHMHPDHVLGATVFMELGARVHGHARLPRALADRQSNYLESLQRMIGPRPLIGTQAPRVSHPVEAESRIDLGQRALVLRSWPRAHTSTDLTVLDVRTGTLFAGDLVFDRHIPTLDGSVSGWLEVLEELSDMPAARVVPGHGDAALPWPAGATNTRRYLEVLARDTRAAIARGDRLGDAVTVIAGEEADDWDLFDAHNARNATVAFTELEWE